MKYALLLAAALLFGLGLGFGLFWLAEGAFVVAYIIGGVALVMVILR